MAEQRIVVEVGRKGKLIVGEPYFTPGVPVVLESKGIGDVSPGDLAVVHTGRGRARVEEVLGPADHVENVLEALLVERGARVQFEPHHPPEPDVSGRIDLRDLPTYTVDPDTAKDFDDALSFRREDGGHPRLGAHRRRLVLRGRRHAARPRRLGARVLDLRPRDGRADAAARARRRPLLAARRTSTACASRSSCRRTASRSSIAR